MKRIFDICAAVISLIVLSPLLVVLALYIRLRMGRPICFRQTRIGLNEKPFQILKFRTMTEARNAEGALLSDSERLTKLGAFMRKSSMDELPELWNVLRGEMSLVGPRPLLPEYLPYYRERERLRHSVRPGLTGLAQVSGRNAVAWDERLELDAKYVERQSLWLDLQLIGQTLFKVGCREGVVVAPGTALGKLSDVRKAEGA